MSLYDSLLAVATLIASLTGHSFAYMCHELAFYDYDLASCSMLHATYVSHFIMCIGRHLLDNLDDKLADETERAPMKKKSAFPIVFFILTHRASPISGLLHRLSAGQQAFLSAWYMHNATAAD